MLGVLNGTDRDPVASENLALKPNGYRDLRGRRSSALIHTTEQGVATEAMPRNAPGRIDATPHLATGGQGVEGSTLALRDQTIEHLQERIDWIQEERERERRQAQAEIDRLVERIEAESEERRTYYRLLTDERKRKPSGLFGLFRSKPAA